MSRTTNTALALPLSSLLCFSLAVAAACATVACSSVGQPAPPAPALPALTIQELMTTVVDPSADALWEAVSTETSASGTVENQPASEEDWLALRQHALRLLQGADRLAAGGLAVARPGAALEDADVAGVLTAPEVQARIAANPAAFRDSAAELGKTAREALAAIDARSPARLVAAGGRIDNACERCHMVFWYPGAAQPSARWPAPLRQGR